MKNAVWILFLAVCTYSCEYWVPYGVEPDPDYHLSSDEVSYLVFKPDTMPSDGKPRVFFDKATYLRNGKDTFVIDVKTEVNYSKRDPSWVMGGSTSLVFRKDTAFERAIFFVAGYTNFMSCFMDVEVGVPNSLDYFWRDVPSKVDTALVLGKVYQGVYKFIVYNKERPKTKVRLVYYAKKYGFIRIETMEGNKLEFIGLHSDYL